MARRFRRFRRFRSYRRGFRRGGFGGGNGMLATVGGVAAGYLAPRVSGYQDLIITAVAVAPVRMPRTIRRLAGGYVIGSMLKHFTGGVIQSSGGTDFV